jgi:hypothetical protein
MPQGSVQEWDFTFTTVNEFSGQITPYPITGATWEYVVRNPDGSPLISVTTGSSADGVIAVTDTGVLSQVQLTLTPAATADLDAQGYPHALWMNPSTATAFCWFTGQLVVSASPQP